MNAVLRKILTKIIMYLADKYKTLSKEMLRLRAATYILKGVDIGRLSVLGLVVVIALGAVIGVAGAVFLVGIVYQLIARFAEFSSVAVTLTWAGGISFVVTMIILLIATSERVAMAMFSKHGGAAADFVNEALKDAKKTTRKE
jgi:hypothetical protein